MNLWGGAAKSLNHPRFARHKSAPTYESQLGLVYARVYSNAGIDAAPNYPNLDVFAGVRSMNTLEVVRLEWRAIFFDYPLNYIR